MPYVEDIAKPHAAAAGGPGFIARPGEKTYNIYPQGLGGPVEEYYPTSTAGRPDLRSISIRMPQEYEPQGYDIEDMPQVDYDAGRTEIQRQFINDVKMADGFKLASPETYQTLMAEAAMNMRSRMGKLNIEKDRADMTFKQIRQTPDLSQEEQFTAKTKYYDSNPVWRAPKIRPEKALTPVQQMMSQMMGELGGQPVNPIIGPTGQPITAPATDRTSLLAEYRRLGGSRTAEGRAFADNYLR